MKWFFALNENATYSEIYTQMARVAVYSAYLHTDLEPYCIYDGTPNPFTAWLEAHGIEIIYHRVSIYDQLLELSLKTGRKLTLTTGSGAFLRVDIPQIMRAMGWQDQKVLYTDVDVIFKPGLSLEDFPCQYFAVAPEATPEDYVNINSGVMLMNIPALLETYWPFMTFIRKHLAELVQLLWDQTAYLTYYHAEWDCLPAVYNWKPYWGSNPEAKVIHFHGPKPQDQDNARQVKPVFKRLILGDYLNQAMAWKEDYERASRESFSFATRIRDKVNFTPVITPFPADIDTDDWRASKGIIALGILIKPDDASCYELLSKYCTLHQNYLTALYHLKFALNLAPDSAHIKKLIGTNLYCLGRLDTAEQAFLDALSQTPQDVDLLVSLGKLYTDQCKYPQALIYLEKALEIAPGDRDAQIGWRVARSLSKQKQA